MARAAVLLATLSLGCTGLVHSRSDATQPPGLADAANPAGDVAPEPVAPHGPACEAPAPDNPSRYHHAVGYEAFVRSFMDSDGDGIGDLDGLASRLDYLNDGDPATDADLGIDLLWLMPVTESPSYHGYDVADYGRVEADYGGDAAFDRFVAEARRRGIRVVLDLVLNHSSSEHPWFVESAAGLSSARRDWYVWSPEKLDWQKPWGPGQTWFRKGDAWYYALFWQGMPDLNWRTPAVRDEMTAIAKAWVARGADGYRLDAVRYLVEDGPGAGQADAPDTHAHLRAFRAALAAERPDVLLVGEVWERTEVVAPYFGSSPSDEIGMLFDFDLAQALVQGIRSGRAGTVRDALCGRLRGWPAWGAAGTFLTNHDMVRVATEVEAGGPATLRLAAALLFGLPGTPWIYYGEEIGMRNGGSGDDAAKRLPMQWAAGDGAGFTTGAPWLEPASTAVADTVAGQTASPDSLLSLYRRLVRARAAHPALRAGATRVARADPAAPSLLVVSRESGDDRLLLVFNLSGKPAAAAIAPDAVPAATAFADLLGGQGATRASAASPLALGTLDAWGFRLLHAVPGTSAPAL